MERGGNSTEEISIAIQGNSLISFVDDKNSKDELTPLNQDLGQKVKPYENEVGINYGVAKVRYDLCMLMFNGWKPWSQYFEYAQILLIFINILCFILATEKSIAQVAWVTDLFNLIEDITVAFFTIDWILRLWVCIDREKYSGRPWFARFRFIISLTSILDIISVAPFYVALVIVIYFPSLHDLRFVATLRIFRIVRLFKADEYSQSLTTIGGAIKQQKDILLATLFLCTTLLICQSTLLWFAMRHDDGGLFASIPATMWYSVMQLTGVGGYEPYPYNVGAKILISFTAVTAVALFAIPTGIIANGFLEVYEKKKKEQEDLKLKEEKQEEKERMKALGLKDATKSFYCPKCGHHWWETITSIN